MRANKYIPNVKRALGTLVIVLGWTPTVATATDYKVSTEVTRKNVLLEDFTGIHCLYCADGHNIASRLQRISPDIYVMAIHSGSFAVPNPDEPDFITEEGSAINTFFEAERKGYPSGMVNRKDFGIGTVTGRSYWTANSRKELAENAPLNLYIESGYNGENGELTVHVEGFYTAEALPDSICLCVALTQSGIKGPQNGGNMGDEYIHNHVLRQYITPLWGDLLTPARQGEYFSKDYTLTLPADIKGIPLIPADIEVVAFATSGTGGEVLQVAGGIPHFQNYSLPLSAEIGQPKVEIATYYGYQYFELQLSNRSTETITSCALDITVNGVTETCLWEGNISAMDRLDITVPRNYSVSDNSLNTYSIQITELNGQPFKSNILEGSFMSPVLATPDISLAIKTNKEPGDAIFHICDDHGREVVSFGPYPDGEVTEVTETAELEKDKVYCFEVFCPWGLGMYSPKGYVVMRNSDNSIMEQVYDIPKFGVRTFFRTSKEASGIMIIEKNGDSNEDCTIYNLNGQKLNGKPKSGFVIRNRKTEILKPF